MPKSLQNKTNHTKLSDIHQFGECWLDYIKDTIKPVSEALTQNQINQGIYLIEKITSELEKNYKLKAKHEVIGGFLHHTHIDEKSTIDLLLFTEKTLGKSTETTSEDLEELLLLRNFTQNITSKLFPEAKIDDSQPLALEMSIPSRFGNLRLFFGLKHTSQASASGFISKTYLLHNTTKKLLFTNPAKIASELNKKNRVTNQNAKILIRLIKRLKRDSKAPYLLSGYEITGLVYSLDDYALGKPTGQILFLLLECNMFFKRIVENPFLKRSIIAPDGNPIIDAINEPRIIESLNRLIYDLELLIKHLVLEVDLYTNIPQESSA